MGTKEFRTIFLLIIMYMKRMDNEQLCTRVTVCILVQDIANSSTVSAKLARYSSDDGTAGGAGGGGGGDVGDETPSCCC